MIRTLAPYLLLSALAAASGWLLFSGRFETAAEVEQPGHLPDFYMENFTTTTMGADGRPRRRIEATYMAHFPDTDTNEFTEPYLVVFKEAADPWHVRSERGWLSANGEVMLLLGKVRIWRNTPDGVRRLDIVTEDLRVLPESDYGETDKPVVITTAHSETRGIGMRAFMDASRIELLSEVRTTYARNAFEP